MRILLLISSAPAAAESLVAATPAAPSFYFDLAGDVAEWSKESGHSFDPGTAPGDKPFL